MTLLYLFEEQAINIKLPAKHTAFQTSKKLCYTHHVKSTINCEAVQATIIIPFKIEMSLLVPMEVFKWLQNYNEPNSKHTLNSKDIKRNSKNQICLPESYSNQYFDGLIIVKIIKRILAHNSKSPSGNEMDEFHLEKLKNIKENSTPAIRLYNWNLITDVLKYLGFALNYGEKTRILNQESDVIAKVLEFLKSIDKTDSGSSLSMLESSVGSMKTSAVEQGLKKQGTLEASSVSPQSSILKVDINNIENKSYTDATNIMEFFVMVMCKNFKLSPQHTLNLFLDQNKYLTHLLVKGIKEAYEPILNFLSDIREFLKFMVMSLFTLEEQTSIEFFMNVLKPCFISKDLPVSLNCLDILKELHGIYRENSISMDVLNEWMQNQGINTLLFSSKRHESILEKAMSLGYLYMGQSMFNFLQPFDKSVLWSTEYEKLQFYYKFLNVITLPETQTQISEAFSQSDCLKLWNLHCWKLIKKNRSSHGQTDLLIKICCITWTNFTEVFEHSTDASNSTIAQAYVSYLKGLSFSSNFMLFMESIKIMFDLMGAFAERKNRHAPIFYKTLINCLAYESNQERTVFLVNNFMASFEEIQSLPGSPLVEPLLHSIERNCVMPALNLGKLLVDRNKVTEGETLQIIEMFSKVFFEDINHGKVAIDYVFECLLHVDQQTKEDFVLKNSQLTLSHFYSLSRSINRSYEELLKNLRRYSQSEQQNEGGLSSMVHNESLGQPAFLATVKKFLILENLVTFLTEAIKDGQQTKAQLQESVFLTYVRIKNDLRKPRIAEILQTNVLKMYYDIHQELQAKIRQYEEQDYSDLLKISEQKKFDEGLENEGGINRNTSLIHSQVYEGSLQSSIMGGEALGSSFLERSQRRKVNPHVFKPELSAIKDIEAIKKKRMKMRLMTEQQDRKRDMIEQKKQLIRSNLNENRLLRFGVASSSNQKDIEYKSLVDFDSVKDETHLRPNGVPHIEIFHMKQEEEDQFMVDADQVMKKYRKLWKFLFFKYSTFGAKHNGSPTNLELSKTEEKINIAEIWKLHRDYKTDFVKKEESFTIIRLVNEDMKRKHDTQNLTYIGFEEYMMQYAYYAYNRLGLTNLSPGQKVSKMIQKFKEVTLEKGNGGNIELFDNPEEVYFQDSDVIKEFNRRLMVSPEYILPEGYKKVRVSEGRYFYETTQIVKETLTLQKKSSVKMESYLDVLEVLDQVLFFGREQFGFHILQPKIMRHEKVLAKPVLFQQLNEKMKNYKNGYLMPKREVNSTYIIQREKISPIKPQFHPKIEFSLGIKIGLASVPLKNKYIGEEVAFWVDDLLGAVEAGTSKVGNKSKKVIENDALKKKKFMLHKKKMEMSQKQKLYKQRSQSVKVEYEKIQEAKKQSKRERIMQIKQQRIQEKQEKEKEMKKKMKEFEEAKKYFSQKQQKQKEKLVEAENKKKRQKQQYKKNVEEYFIKKKFELEERELSMKKNKEYEERKKEQEKEKKRNLQKKVHLTVIKKDVEAVEKIQTAKQKYDQFSRSSFVLEEFELHRKPLGFLFDLLVKYEKSKISTTDKNEISVNTFNFFALKFKICPFILQKNNVARIFRSANREDTSRKSTGLSYKAFEDCLLRIVVKSKSMLNKLAQKRRQNLLKKSSSNPPISEEKEEYIDESHYDRMKAEQENLDQSKISMSRMLLNENSLTDEYLFDTEGVTQETIRQFMIFLNLPDDKLSVDKRFREAIESKNFKPAKVLRKEMKQSETLIG